MGKSKWYLNGNFIILLLSVIGTALVAVAEELTRGLRNRHRRSRKGGTHKRSTTTKTKPKPKPRTINIQK